MTNWPSSCGGGVYPLTMQELLMASESIASKKAPPCQSVSEDTILKIAKEITVKFIEVGKITPATFALSFKDIYSAIDRTVHKG